MSINLSDFGSQENLQIFRAENSMNFLASQKPNIDGFSDVQVNLKKMILSIKNDKI